MTDKMKLRIEQLLRKAESTTPEEAEALTAAAEKLMIKYGIERAMLDVNAEAKVKDEIITHKIHLVGRWQDAWLDGFTAVVNAMGLRALQSNAYGLGGKYLWVVGFKKDVEDVSQLIESLKIQSEVALVEWYKSFKKTDSFKYYTAHERHVERRTFMEYFGLGAARRIREERRAAMRDTIGAELVLFDRTKKITEYVNDVLGVNRVAPATKRDVGAHGGNAGLAAGERAVTKKGVNGSPARSIAG